MEDFERDPKAKVQMIEESDSMVVATPSARDPSVIRMRILLYLHMVVIGWLTIMTLSDSGQIALPAVIKTLFHFQPVELLLMLSWVVFPVLIANAAWKIRGRSFMYRFGAIAIDLLLSTFQLWAMLPTVQ